jgi:PAS domain S-box-containing protein
MVRLSGYSRGELLGKLASTLLLPKEEWETLQERNRERLKGASEKYESKMKRKDGSVFRALFDAFPYRDENGDIRGTLAIVTPIDQ